jgi:hypothetical protein
MGKRTQHVEVQRLGDAVAPRTRKKSWLKRWRQRRRTRKISMFRQWLETVSMTFLLNLIFLPVGILRGYARGAAWGRNPLTYHEVLLISTLAVIGNLFITSVAFFIWKYEEFQRRKWR